MVVFDEYLNWSRYFFLHKFLLNSHWNLRILTRRLIDWLTHILRPLKPIGQQRLQCSRIVNTKTKLSHTESKIVRFLSTHRFLCYLVDISLPNPNMALNFLKVLIFFLASITFHSIIWEFWIQDPWFNFKKHSNLFFIMKDASETEIDGFEWKFSRLRD